jgi:hypothetical protein
MFKLLTEKFKYYECIISSEVVKMNGMKTNMRVRVIPGKDNDFYMTVENVRGPAHIWQAVREELKERFPEGWGRAYVVDEGSFPFMMVLDHEPTPMEEAVMKLISVLECCVNVPFFETLFELAELFKGAPYWEVSFGYPDYGAEIKFNETQGKLKVEIFEQAPEPVCTAEVEVGV